MTKLLDKIINWGIVILVFLLPLFFLPITSEFYEFNKNILLFVVCCLLFVVWTLKMVLEKKVSFRRTPFDLPVLAICLAFIISTIFASSNKVEALTLPGGTGTILALTVLYFLITNITRKNTESNTERHGTQLITALIASGVILSLMAIYQFIGIGEAFVPVNARLDFLRVKTFSPAGGLLPLATFLLVLLVLIGSTLIEQIKNRLNRSVTSVSLSVVSVSLIGVALTISIYQLLTTARPPLLPYSISWQIAVETFKNWRLFLFGVGPSSFLVAFNQFRPVSFNLSNLWALKFGVSSNFYFHLLTTVGILGLGAFLWLALCAIKTQMKQITTDQTDTESVKSVFISVISVFLLLVFLPANLLLLFVSYVLLGALGANLVARQYSEESRILPWVIFVIVLSAVVCSLYAVSRAYAAEVYFKRSLDALSQNKGTETYNLQIKAISFNPYNNIYRRAYSQTNLALANSLAANPPSGGLSDQDRENISILVQQAIREAKTAVALNPDNAIDWENLGSIYRNLINFAQGSDSWTISSFQQAIVLDPVNPLLRLSLGGVYYSLQNWDEAIKRFEQAVNLKPNFANGHYNLAAAYREKQEYEKAIAEMEVTLSLVSRDSDDWKKANTELEALKKRLGERAEKESQKPSETLTPPQPAPAGIKPPLSLPTGVEPEISPSPEASPTP